MARILIATGDTRLYDILAAEVQSVRHEVLWAAEGNEAYHMALDHAPDVILLDAHLSVFSGLEVSVLLRNDPEVAPTLPVILLSDNDIDIHELEKARVTALFPKQHLAQDLHDLLVKCLGPLAAA